MEKETQRVIQQVRSIYSELQGFLLAAPNPEKTSWITELSLGHNVNRSIQELNEITGKNYDKYKIETRHEMINRSSMSFIRPKEYLSQLTGLIYRLKGEYFYDEARNEAPNTVINQTQVQSQQQTQSMIVELAMQVAEKRSEYPTGTNERKFLDALGESLKSVRSISEIIQTIISLAKSIGVSLESLAKIFGL